MISASEGITFPTAPDAGFAGKLAHLATRSRTAFDTAYLPETATLHDVDGAETHRIVQRHIATIRGAPPP